VLQFERGRREIQRSGDNLVPVAPMPSTDHRLDYAPLQHLLNHPSVP
jgi:hypothetical protein